MDLNFLKLDLFIIKFYKKSVGIDVKVSIKKSVIYIESIDSSIFDMFWIEVKQKFSFSSEYSHIEDVLFKKYSDKLLLIINNYVSIPLLIQMWKELNSFDISSIFLTSFSWELWDISKNQIDLFNNSKVLFTNNILELEKLLKSLNVSNKIINGFEKIDEKSESLSIVNYWDIFECDKSLNYSLVDLSKSFTNIFTLTNSTNFINKYSLSHTNYGSLLYFWIYNSNNIQEISSNIDEYLSINRKIISEYTLWNMISLSWITIDFLELKDLISFVNTVSRDRLGDDFICEVIYETQKWYYNMVDYLAKIDLKFFSEEINTSNISMYIFPKISNDFIWYKKYNSYNSEKKFIYLSSPLSNNNEFTNRSIQELEKSRYIYWESIPWVEKFMKQLKISPVDKEVLYWEDIEGINDYIKLNNLTNTNKVQLVKNVFPDLISNLENSDKVTFLTDGWAPCILDPWDNFKKYINLYYPEYSVIWIKWPNVISTVMLSCLFSYKYIYWAPLIYSIYPVKDYLKEIWFFQSSYFEDTVIVFYSFWQNLKKDIEIFLELLWEKSSIQIIWDIWREREYNRSFWLTNIWKVEVNYISKNINNIVYILKINN